MYYDYQYYVDSRDTDPFGQCRPSAVLGFLQEAATEAAMALHVSREEMLERHNAFWMLARIWYRLDRPISWNETVAVRTWHRGGKGASMYRDFDLTVGGALAGEAVSVWVLADRESHKPLRLSRLDEFQGTDGGELCKERTLTRLRLPEEMKKAEERRLWYSDADVNRHVNNSKYADFACDALHLERLGEGSFVSSLQVGFQAECRPGEVLRLRTGRSDGVWYVQGTDGQGSARFDAALTLSELPGSGS